MKFNQQTKPNTPIRYEEMDVLRGLAALIVVFSHFNPHWQRYLSDIPVLIPNSYGTYAVRMFFATSGFVIFMTLEKCTSVVDFAALRFSRLYPAYWATLIFTTAIMVGFFDWNFWAGGFIVNLTMFQEFVGFSHFDNVYWSLTVELAFYLIVAMLMVLGLHQYRLTFVAGWLLISCVWAVTLNDADAQTRSLIEVLFAVDFAPYFCIGIIFYQSTRYGWSVLLMALLAFATFTQYLISGWFDVGLVLAAIFILGIALSGFAHFTVTRATVWLGTISYSLYLVHRNIGYRLLEWMHTHGWGPILSIAMATGLVIGLAGLFTFFIEQPTQRYLRSAYANWRSKRKG